MNATPGELQTTTADADLGGGDLRLRHAAVQVQERLFQRTLPRVRIGRYTLLEHLGEGGMGEVFAAYDERLDRKVAIKIQHRRYGDDPRRDERLIREAQALAQLSHPNVIHVFEAGEVEDQLYIAMEFVRGVTLRDWLSQGARPWSEILAMFVQAGRGLMAAHAAGIVHRDFKPDNVMVGEDGRARVLDFGLARADPSHSELFARGPDSSLTVTGALVDTPAYMSPEQFRCGPVDARTDQFNFCATLWEALYGRRAHGGTNLPARRAAVLAGRIDEPPDGARVPGQVRRALLRGLSVEPGQRYPTMEALLAALTKTSRWRRLGAPALLAAVALGLGVALVLPDDPVARCVAGAEARALAVWNADRRAAMQAAFLATGASYAAATLARVEASVNRQVAAWTRAHGEACASTLARAEQSAALFDRRVLCLHEVLGGLAAQLEVFTAADAAVVERAAEAVDRLADPGRCTAAALAQEQVAALGDVVTAGAVRRVRDQLAAIAAAVRAGRAAQVVETAESVAVAAGASGYPPVRAEALLQLGAVQLARDAFARADESLFSALEIARASGARELALRAMVDLVEAQHRLDRPREALRWARLAAAEVDAATDPELVAKLLIRHSAVMWGLGNYDESEALLRRAETRTGGALAAATAAKLRRRLARARWQRGDFDAGEALLDEVLATVTADLGPDHPDVADVLADLGHIAIRRGQNERTIALYEQVLAIRERAFGPQHSLVAQALNALGAAHGNLRRLDEARGYFERSLRVLEAAHGPRHFDLTGVIDNLAQLGHALGDEAYALAMARRGLEIREATLGPAHPELAYALVTVADFRLAAGDHAGAAASYERALRVRRGSDVDAPIRGRAALGLARALTATGDARARALALVEEAVAIFSREGSAAEYQAEAEQLRAELRAAMSRRGGAPGR